MNIISNFIKTYALYCLIIIGFIIGFVISEFVSVTDLRQVLGYIFYKMQAKHGMIYIQFLWLGPMIIIACVITDYLYQLYQPRTYLKRWIHGCTTIFVVFVICDWIYRLFGKCATSDTFFYDSQCIPYHDGYEFFNVSNITLIVDFIVLAIGIGMLHILERFSFYNKIGQFIKRIISFLKSSMRHLI